MSIAPPDIDETTDLATTVEVEGLGTIVTIKPELVARHKMLAQRRAELGTITRENYLEADKLIGDQVRHDREVDEAREAFNKPHLEVTKLANEAARGAMFGDLRKPGDRKLIEDVAAIKRKLDEEARQAEAERQRAADEAIALAEKAKLEAEQRQRAIDELREVAATPDDKLAVAELEAEHIAQTREDRKVAGEASGRAWLLAAEQESSAPPRSGASSRGDVEVEVFDLQLVPMFVNGIQTAEPITKAIKRLLQANVPVPGCRLKPKTVVTAGRRK